MKKIIIILIVSFFIIPIYTGAKEQIDLNNKFGFLSGPELDKSNFNYYQYTGAGWARPHVGPAVWQLIQDKESADYNWEYMDNVVVEYQNNGLNLLITIWPFANWDQKNRKNADSCKVSDDDIFLPISEDKNDNKDGKNKEQDTYLPLYRCNPKNWNAYQDWVQAMVERYDGDGSDDMPGLKYGVKYWEVMNEPDLDEPVVAEKDDKKTQDEEETESLDFYKQGYKDYYQLLKITHNAIKTADPQAKVLIAGAAGGNDQFLGFYENIFKKYKKAKNYFDIGNVHCISNDHYNNFNVKAYIRMLNKYKINKKTWVTEADAMLYGSKEENYSQTRKSTKKALSAGASKIFYTTRNFNNQGSSLKYSKNKFKTIIDKFN